MKQNQFEPNYLAMMIVSALLAEHGNAGYRPFAFF